MPCSKLGQLFFHYGQHEWIEGVKVELLIPVPFSVAP